MKKTIDDINVRGLRVLVRHDLNVPLDEHQNITDDTRLQTALPTIEKLRKDGGRLILMSHLGRPEGKPDDRTKFSLAPAADWLTDRLGGEVVLLPDCVGEHVDAAVATLSDGDVCMLENLRFHEAEQIKDKNAAKDESLRRKKDDFARQIAELGDAYVNDAFATCHRDNASMLTVPQMMADKPRVIGYLVQRELKFLGEALHDPKRPFIAILGGAKVSDKISVIEALIEKCDAILVGGAMAFTFLAAEGRKVGKSLVEPDRFDTARSLRHKAGGKLKLPVDSVVAESIGEGVTTSVCEEEIPDEWMGLDIGPRTVKTYEQELRGAKTIFWNGPMGVFETKPFAAGTFEIARALAEATQHGALTIVGGGDSAAAIAQAGLTRQISHVSTGGGASLEFLEGRAFAALEVLEDA